MINGFFTWTINLKSFEIKEAWVKLHLKNDMNYKLEKFWNFKMGESINLQDIMNYKLEKFWNGIENLEIEDENIMN